MNEIQEKEFQRFLEEKEKQFGKGKLDEHFKKEWRERIVAMDVRGDMKLEKQNRETSKWYLVPIVDSVLSPVRNSELGTKYKELRDNEE